jgi:biopolymer transport protein ExbB
MLLTTPPDFTPLAMVRHADSLVKAVMFLLAVASLATWSVLFAKAWELRRQARELGVARRALLEVGSLGEARTADGLGGALPVALLGAAVSEFRLSSGDGAATGLSERVAMRLARIELAWSRQARRGIGLLATIGATAPFVGLFGTVWGIMNSFVGIARANATSLAVVAPGIAEALLATAFGLAAAIPAVVIYNHFTRSLASLRGVSGDLVVGVQILVSRDIDRMQGGVA